MKLGFIGCGNMASAMIGEGTDYANLAIKDELNAEEYGVAFRRRRERRF